MRYVVQTFHLDKLRGDLRVKDYQDKSGVLQPEYRSVGVLEYWNGLASRIFQLFHTITPSLQNSNNPSFCLEHLQPLLNGVVKRLDMFA
jgi:hypothetical protein